MAIVLNDISLNYINDLKDSLRIKSDVVNNEIKSLIMAARLDLALAGITNQKINNEEDYLVKNAIINYLRSEFGLDNKDSEKYRNSYNMMRDKMAISQEYMATEAENELE